MNFLKILRDLALFSRTCCEIDVLRRDAARILQNKSECAVESCRYLPSGPYFHSLVRSRPMLAFALTLRFTIAAEIIEDY